MPLLRMDRTHPSGGALETCGTSAGLVPYGPPDEDFVLGKPTLKDGAQKGERTLRVRHLSRSGQHPEEGKKKAA
jgi:hypothetical protein